MWESSFISYPIENVIAARCGLRLNCDSLQNWNITEKLNSSQNVRSLLPIFSISIFRCTIFQITQGFTYHNSNQCRSCSHLSTGFANLSFEHLSIIFPHTAWNKMQYIRMWVSGSDDTEIPEIFRVKHQCWVGNVFSSETRNREAGA